MRGALAATALRIAGGIGIVACAAVIALAAGGGGLFGGLGGLFGSSGASLQVAKDDVRAADIVASPNAADRAPARARRLAALGPGTGGSPGSRGRRAPSRRQPNQPRGGQPTPAPTPGPLQPPPGPPPGVPPNPTPTPGGGQTVATVRDTLDQVTNQAPPQLQPLTRPAGDAVDTIVQTCKGLPVCP